MRFFACTLLICFHLPAATTQDRWRYIPRNPAHTVSMEWKRVLNSEYGELIRREVPPEAASILSSIHFIEGIERVLLSIDGQSRLLVLEGVFNTGRLREMAAADRPAIKTHRNVQILVPDDGDSAGIALVSQRLLVMGRMSSLVAALDRAAAIQSADAPPGRYDLWIASRSPSAGIEQSSLGFRIEKDVVVLGRIRTKLPGALGVPEETRGPLKFTQSTDAQEYDLSASFGSREQLEPFAGHLRAMLEQGVFSQEDGLPFGGVFRQDVLARAPAKPEPRLHGVIRIYGLDEGVREIPMPAPMQAGK